MKGFIVKIILFLIVLILSIVLIVVLSRLGLAQPISLLISFVIPGVVAFSLLIIFKILTIIMEKAFSGTYQNIASEAYLKGDYEKAKKYFKAGCKINNPESFCGLAYMYDLGKGVKQDYGKARELYEKAVEKNSPVACNNLGVFYEQGHGVEQNYSIASSYYEKACVLKYPLSFANLGTFYEHGLGVQQNSTKASELYKKGCDLGDKDGCNALASLNKTSKEVKEILDNAKKFKKANNIG